MRWFVFRYKTILMKTGIVFFVVFLIGFFVNGQSINDRTAILDLINNYSRYADRREPQNQADLFAKNATIEIYHSEPGNSKPDTILRGRSQFITGFETLKKYDVTMHFNGQSIIEIKDTNATGETYCLAHHLWVEEGKRMLMVIGIRYYDNFIRIKNQWFFARRKLIFDWSDKRPSSP
jgi:SnoaL-like domain